MKYTVLKIALVAMASIVLVGYMSGRQPDRNDIVAASREFDTPFRRVFVDANGVKLHVVIAGPDDGKPIILLHGYPEFWYAWRGVAADLARKGYRVIIPDQRGYGRSAKPSGASSYRLELRQILRWRRPLQSLKKGTGRSLRHLGQQRFR